MKAVIVEIREYYVAALSDDGRIYKIKNDNYAIGQEIKMKKQIFKNGFIKCAASCAAALTLFAVPAWAYYTPYSYVSLDINPSVEYSLNRFDRVLDVKAVNEDGEEILKEINLNDLKNKNIEEAVKEVLNEIIEAGLLSEGEEGGVVVAASSKGKEKSEELTLKLKVTVEEEVKKDSEELKVEVEAVSVAQERVQEAKELGVTPGKLNLVQKLQESAENPDDIDVKEWLDKPVKEIMKATKENKKQEKQADKEKDKKDKKDKEDKEDKKYKEDKEDAENENDDEDIESNDKDDKDHKDKKDNNGNKDKDKNKNKKENKNNKN